MQTLTFPPSLIGEAFDPIVPLNAWGKSVGELLGNIFIALIKTERPLVKISMPPWPSLPHPHNNSFLLSWRLHENVMLGMAVVVLQLSRKPWHTGWQIETHLKESAFLMLPSHWSNLETTYLWASIIHATFSYTFHDMQPNPSYMLKFLLFPKSNLVIL